MSRNPAAEIKRYPQPVPRVLLDPTKDWMCVGKMNAEGGVVDGEREVLLVAEIMAEEGALTGAELRVVLEAGAEVLAPEPKAAARSPTAEEANTLLCLGRPNPSRTRWIDWLADKDDAAFRASVAACLEAAGRLQGRGVLLGAAARADRQYMRAEAEAGGGGPAPCFFFHIEHCTRASPQTPPERDVLGRDMLHFLAGAHASPPFRDRLLRLFPAIAAFTVLGRAGPVAYLGALEPLCRAAGQDEMDRLAATGTVLDVSLCTLAHGAQLPAHLADLAAEVHRCAAGAGRGGGRIWVRALGGEVEVATEDPRDAERGWIARLRAAASRERVVPVRGEEAGPFGARFASASAAPATVLVSAAAVATGDDVAEVNPALLELAAREARSRRARRRANLEALLEAMAGAGF